MVLPTIEEDFSPIVLRAHGEVNPVGRASLLLDQFIQFPAVLVCSSDLTLRFFPFNNSQDIIQFLSLTL
jgi:hypothetical protein